MEPLAEYVDGLPNICGQEPLISEALHISVRPEIPGVSA